jgi:uncharacterized membrane protein YdjX (TVP38/TMEM64 family)
MNQLSFRNLLSGRVTHAARRSFPRYRVRHVLALIVLFGICCALNTVPSLVATTAVVTLFAFRDDVGAVEAVVVGVLGAAVGRVCFALLVRHGATRFLRGRLRRNVDFLEEYVSRKRNATRFLSLLAMMPVNPALAIFATAGALRLRLAPITACYMVGRAVVYGWAVWTASVAVSSLERVLRENASPWTFAAGIALALVPLVIAAHVDWQTLIEQRRVRLLPRSQM